MTAPKGRGKGRGRGRGARQPGSSNRSDNPGPPDPGPKRQRRHDCGTHSPSRTGRIGSQSPSCSPMAGPTATLPPVPAIDPFQSLASTTGTPAGLGQPGQPGATFPAIAPQHRLIQPLRAVSPVIDPTLLSRSQPPVVPATVRSVSASVQPTAPVTDRALLPGRVNHIISLLV